MTVHRDDVYAQKGKNGDYKSDRWWSMRHVDEVRNRFAEYWGRTAAEGLRIGTPMEDCFRMGDLVLVLPIPGFRGGTKMRIGVRMRREGYEHYTDFTIRCERDSGMETELPKIINGWGDFFMYCRGDSERLTEYMIINLENFRIYRRDYLRTHGSQEPGILKDNRDGTRFRAYEPADMPKGVVVVPATKIPKLYPVEHNGKTVHVSIPEPEEKPPESIKRISGPQLRLDEIWPKK
jgi:hypothetical protein